MAKYPARVNMGTAKPVAPKAKTPKPTASKPRPAAPAYDMSTKAILARSERVQREEARGDEAFLRKNQPGVARTTVNERPTPTKKGKK